uniref:Succinate:cytochrome c oxidoreductase subunit 3 n=2 Tax=Gelidium TaxID=2811 RepID=A0A1D8X7K3_9FLOR|nr:succinate:cytochrome c oxidoreductase subunit 3 [Gelidium sinicola]YP_009559268.1 succinate:cytochrome c oxidoreductase subunit 3 [Gelidium coulteri]AOX49016.1 succinate:cytochrome c oxidoreductase subunit 3 [Gelidium sinicola]QBA96115.1 succinate:cytochrome c oxidoreductase subunit 3 [Gelidium coulteri]
MLQYFLSLNRPLSPHLTIYTPQSSSLSSIWHRLSGIFMVVLLILELNFIKSAFSCEPQKWVLIVESVLIYEVKKSVLILSTSIFLYHLMSGLRYLIWDLGLFLYQYFSTVFITFISFGLVLFLFFNLIN